MQLALFQAEALDDAQAPARSHQEQDLPHPGGAGGPAEAAAPESHSSLNQVVVQLLEQGLPETSPFGRVRALRSRLARQRSVRGGPVPRFTKDELHEDEEA